MISKIKLPFKLTKRFFSKLLSLPYKILRKVKQIIILILSKIKRTFIAFAKLFKNKKFRRILYILLSVILISAYLVYVFKFDGKNPKEIQEFLKNETQVDILIWTSVLTYLIAITIFLYTLFSLLFKRKTKAKFIFKSTLILALLLAVGTVAMQLGYTNRHPNIWSNYPKYNESLDSYDKPIQIDFNLPVRKSKLKPSITPTIKGVWVWEDYYGIEDLTKTGKFYPEVSPYPEERFVVYIAGINKLTDAQEHEYGFVFFSPSLPKVTKTIPINNSENIDRTKPIEIHLDKDNRELVDWKFNIEPKFDYDIDRTEPTLVKIIPRDPLDQSQEYKIQAHYAPKKMDLIKNTLAERKDSIKVLDLKFKIANEPQVKSFNPRGNYVKIDSKINVHLNEPTSLEQFSSHFSVEPTFEKEITQLSDSEFEVTPKDKLPKDKKYTVRLHKGMISTNGGTLENNIKFEFKTIGKVKVKAISPGNGSTGVSEYAEIVIDFDQPVDKKFAEKSFSLKPSTSGKIRWSKNTLIFKPNNPWNYETTYTLKVPKGIKSVDGLPSDKEHISTFRIRSNIVLFNIPLYYQPPGFACNIFTAKMVLASKGIYVSHTGLISEIGYNDQRSGGHWVGNPYREYVGNSDGSYGYGVYSQPIQRIFSNRGISTQAHTGWNAAGLAKELEKGHPVIVWRYNGVGGGQNISWTAWDGTYVNAFNGMHGTVVSGFIGSSNNPSSFYMNDPWLGKFWLDAGSFDYYWSFSGRMALVVY